MFADSIGAGLDSRPAVLLCVLLTQAPAEYKELWRVILAEFIEQEVKRRLVGGDIPCIEGFSFSGTWCVSAQLCDRVSGR